MITYDLTDAELDNYIYEKGLMEKRSRARYLNEEIAELETMLNGYTTKRAELKAQHQSTREVAKTSETARNTLKQIKKSLQKFNSKKANKKARC